MKGFIEEFKAFAMKGNVVDLAVAVVIGAAFGKIVSSLVDNIIMPLVGVLLGGVDFTGYSAEIGDASVTYGVFLQSVVDFVIIAFVIFLVIKAINKAQGPEEKKEEAPAEPPEDIKLLREIRDSLRR
ncbi:MAG: large-conductance mechanosensitive channel protein MscL [Candidatus Paceibacterota bacterium]